VHECSDSCVESLPVGPWPNHAVLCYPYVSETCFMPAATSQVSAPRSTSERNELLRSHGTKKDEEHLDRNCLLLLRLGKVVE
jgi:hypothetical protein